MENMVINSQLVKQILNRKATKLASLNFIFKELAERVMSRLEFLRLNPQRILDCGSGLGFDRALLQQKYPQAQLYELDISLQILRQHISSTSRFKFFKPKSSRYLICGDANSLPLVNGSMDFCYANLLIPYLGDPQAFIKEMRRVLKLGGAFCISGLGVDSFRQLRELGLSSYTFPDMHDIGDMLIAAGFSNPVVDTEYITLEYDDLATLIGDVRLVGCASAKPGAAQSPRLSKSGWQKLNQALPAPAKLTLEIFVAHGWKDYDKIDLPAGYSPIKFSK